MLVVALSARSQTAVFSGEKLIGYFLPRNVPMRRKVYLFGKVFPCS